MFDSGDWLFPHRGTRAVLRQAAAVLLVARRGLRHRVGNWRMAFLLPSLLAALGTLWLRGTILAAACGRIASACGRRSRCCSRCSSPTRPSSAQIDPLVVFFITLAQLRPAAARVARARRGQLVCWIGCFAAGLGVISKGVGFLALLMLIPCALACAGAAGTARRYSARARLAFWSCGALAFVAASCVWLVPMIVIAALASGDPEYRAYIDDILFKQTAKRYAASWDHHAAGLVLPGSDGRRCGCRRAGAAVG